MEYLRGTATLVNWLAGKTFDEQERLVSCIVLESVLGYGNSAIFHTVETFAPRITTFLPFARAWIPWAAKKIQFPLYNPFGKQLIYSAQRISPRIPVIIMHNRNDPQLSINDARKLYCVLRKNDNDNVYLMEIEGSKWVHLDILNGENKIEKNKKIAVIQTIYKKHGLPYKQMDAVDLKPFQPDNRYVQEKIYQELLSLKTVMRNGIDLFSVGLFIVYLSKYPKIFTPLYLTFAFVLGLLGNKKYYF